MTARKSIDSSVGVTFWNSFRDFKQNKAQLEPDKLMVWLDKTFTAAIRFAHGAFMEWRRVLEIIDGALSTAGGRRESLSGRVTSTLNASLFNLAPDVCRPFI